MSTRESKRISFFGHFGGANFGNESTLQAMLANLRLLAPNAEFNCICTHPDKVAEAHHITAVASRTHEVRPKATDRWIIGLARRIVVGIPNELHQWLRSFETLRDTDALVVPGTGLLTDAYTLLHWGPYDMFRWTVAAKMCRCKVLFVSVGAGPIYSRAGRFFIKTALSLADFRSFRDESTRQLLEGIGFPAGDDPVYPDLVFSLPDESIRGGGDIHGARPVVGLGLMQYAGKYSVERPTAAIHKGYLEALAEFAQWLLASGYDIRLLIGDAVDTHVIQEFRLLLKQRLVMHEEQRMIDEPIESVEDLLKQLASTDLVVATRFHNVLLALFLNKPTIAISFHHKCASLMDDMGLSAYCQDINRLDSGRLIEQFSRLQQDANSVKRLMLEKVGLCREALDEQYAIILREIWGANGRRLS